MTDFRNARLTRRHVLKSTGTFIGAAAVAGLLRSAGQTLAMLVVAVIAVLILPIPPGLLDFALAFNIAFSIVILIATLYITSPLDLSVFPGMLLIVTLIRLSLNVASTRMILLRGGEGEGAAGGGDDWSIIHWFSP